MLFLGFLRLIYILSITAKGIIATWRRLGDERSTKSIEDMILDYDDDKNAMVAISDTENAEIYEDFYEDLDNRLRTEQSMNMIFFGPPISFLRLDTETLLHIFVHTKKHLIPISRALLAWDMLTDGKTAAFLQGREFLAFGTLLNVIPEEDLYYVNFGDPSVLKYFSNSVVNLQSRKYGVLVAAYRRYFGNMWYTNSSQVNELGYFLCGFPAVDLQKISPQTFKELNVDLLSKLDKCKQHQTQTLYKIATHPDAYDEPYKWSSHEIGRLSNLFTCVPDKDISSIQLEAVPAITVNVMKRMHQAKLEYFTKQQILRMNPKTRRIYILRMALKTSVDMSQLSKQNSEGIASEQSSVLSLVLITITLVLARDCL